MRARRRTHHSPVAWSRSDEEFQSQTPRPAWDAAWDRVRAERKQAGLPNTYEQIGFVLGFSITARSISSQSLATDYSLLATVRVPLTALLVLHALHAPHLTLHAPPAGSGRAQTLPR